MQFVDDWLYEPYANEEENEGEEGADGVVCS